MFVKKALHGSNPCRGVVIPVRTYASAYLKNMSISFLKKIQGTANDNAVGTHRILCIPAAFSFAVPCILFFTFILDRRVF